MASAFPPMSPPRLKGNAAAGFYPVPQSIKEPGYGWTVKPGEITPLVLLEEGTGLAKLNESPNVILLFRLQLLRTMSDTNFILAVLTLAYIGVNMVMITFNHLDHNDDECGDPGGVFVARCGSPVSTYVFHLIEFTATFCFSILQAVALLYTPKSMMNIYDNPHALKVVLFFAIVVSFVPTLLVWCNVEYFEVVAHEIEYSNEITMSFVDLVLLGSLLRETSFEVADGKNSFIIAAVATSIAVIQMLIYNCLGETADGGKSGESLAHYCEFVFEILSALIVFWFCVDNKFIADKEIDAIMYGDHRDCAVCNSKSIELQGKAPMSAGGGDMESSFEIPPRRKRKCSKKGCKHLDHD